MKAIQLKYVAVVGLLVLSLANHSFAVDAAEASGVMADLETLVSQAKLTLSKASLVDADAVAEANELSAAIDAAVAAGRDALSTMEQAIANGDAEGAAAAEDAMAAALRQARDLFLGIFPATAAATDTGDDSESEQDENPPNIYDDPWESQGLRAYYESLFGAFQEASSTVEGGAIGGRPEIDATRT